MDVEIKQEDNVVRTCDEWIPTLEALRRRQNRLDSPAAKPPPCSLTSHLPHIPASCEAFPQNQMPTCDGSAQDADSPALKKTSQPFVFCRFVDFFLLTPSVFKLGEELSHNQQTGISVMDKLTANHSPPLQPGMCTYSSDKHSRHNSSSPGPGGAQRWRRRSRNSAPAFLFRCVGACAPVKNARLV